MICSKCKHFNSNSNLCDKLNISVGGTDPIYYHENCKFELPKRNLYDYDNNSGYDDLAVKYDKLLEKYYKLKMELRR